MMSKDDRGIIKNNYAPREELFLSLYFISFFSRIGWYKKTEDGFRPGERNL